MLLIVVRVLWIFRFITFIFKKFVTELFYFFNHYFQICKLNLGFIFLGFFYHGSLLFFLYGYLSPQNIFILLIFWSRKVIFKLTVGWTHFWYLILIINVTTRSHSHVDIWILFFSFKFIILMPTYIFLTLLFFNVKYWALTVFNLRII